MKDPFATNSETGEERSARRTKIGQLEQPAAERTGPSDPECQGGEYFKAIIQNSSDIVFVLDRQGAVTFVSPSVERLLGYRPDELIGKSGFDLMVPEDLPKALENFGRAQLTKEQLIPYAFRVSHRDGSARILEGIGNNLLDHPVVAGFVMNVRDVTEYRNRTKEVKKLNERIEFILGATKTGLDIIDARFNLRYVDPGWQKVYGDPEGMKCHRYFMDRDIPCPGCGIPEAIETRSILVTEERLPKEGNRPIQVTTIPFQNERGEWLVAEVNADITQRKQAEEELRASRMQLSNALEMAHLGPWEYDVVNDLFTFNDNFYKIFRTTAEKAGGYAMRSADYADRFVHPEDKGEVAEEIRKAIETTDPHFEGSLDHRILYADGTVGHISVRFFIVKDADGRTVKTYGVNQDITDRKRAEEALRNLESLRKAVGASVQVMVSAVETRDPYTSGHQTRSADLARMIAAEMGLPQEKIDAIRMAGSIHDIGKLSIPAEILAKPTKLTEIEFSLIREHARKGFEMLKDVESPWPLAEIVYQHHERVDGSGYPRRLQGAEILIEARILAVADTVEAMASHRPYRPGLGVESALAEIERNSGILYDAPVVDACLRLFRVKGFQLATASL